MKKKERCIIHIGMPKTGSSALQESLSSNLFDPKVSYAHLPNPNHSKMLWLFFTDNYQTIHRYFPRLKGSETKIKTFRQQNIDTLIQSFQEDDADTVIFSGEDIFHFPKYTLKSMKAFLEKYFEHILVVGYVRFPKSFINSSFQQLVKKAGIKEFTTSTLFPRYKKLEKIDAVFGEANVKLWKFDPGTFPHSDITLDFCRRLSIAVDPNYQTIRSNDAISREALGIMFLMNKYGITLEPKHFDREVMQKVAEKISSIGNTKFRFSKYLLDQITDQHSEDIRWIENRMHISFNEEYEELADDVTTEKELLTFSQNTIEKIGSLVGETGISDPTIQNIASMMNKFKLELADEMRSSR